MPKECAGRRRGGFRMASQGFGSLGQDRDADVRDAARLSMGARCAQPMRESELSAPAAGRLSWISRCC